MLTWNTFNMAKEKSKTKSNKLVIVLIILGGLLFGLVILSNVILTQIDPFKELITASIKSCRIDCDAKKDNSTSCVTSCLKVRKMSDICLGLCSSDKNLEGCVNRCYDAKKERGIYPTTKDF